MQTALPSYLQVNVFSLLAAAFTWSCEWSCYSSTSLLESKSQDARFLPVHWYVKRTCYKRYGWQRHFFQEKNYWWHGSYTTARWGPGLSFPDHEMLNGTEFLQDCVWIYEADNPRLSCLFWLSLLALTVTYGLWHRFFGGLCSSNVSPLTLCHGFSL